ncbi:uncharacterized protein LOC6580362 [Drosophila mojavensis]|uniref:Uncharacterized protein n=1 Tax=Drosophila mojavensis TaxID=7230 RepID=B4KPE8_DROMO|nr:uncharacterized protein LOC6580362 [Drosophila mojavensis]EDW10144.1 uncharacterized protein Dmoj_GI20915 [Drosophila mojavensis]
MQSLRNNFSSLTLAALQKCSKQFNQQLFASIGFSKRGLDTLYGAESCEDCVESYRISPAREDLKRIEPPDPFKSKDPCWQSLRRTEYKCRTDPEFMIDSFVNERKKCLADPCAFDVPRADLKYYRPSDKLKKKYPRTWIKCVMKRRKVKMQCAWKPVKYERRTFKKFVPKDACEAKPCTLGAPDLGLVQCLKKTEDSPCPRVTMPGCQPGRVPPKCTVGFRKPKDCRKRLTKYPAFSECLIDPLPTAPPVECNCLKTPSMCSVWEYFRNKKS